MAEHRNIVDRMIGLEEKREFHEFENRAQKLGENYYDQVSEHDFQIREILFFLQDQSFYQRYFYAPP